MSSPTPRLIFFPYYGTILLRKNECLISMDFTGKQIWSIVSESKMLMYMLCFQVTIPQSNIIILTDPASDLQMRRNRVTFLPIQGEYSRDRLMLQRIRSYIVRAHCIYTRLNISVVGQ